MVSRFSAILALGGVIVFGALKSSGTAGAVRSGVALNTDQVYKLSQYMVQQYYPNVDPVMLTAMAQIESSYRVGAYRWESHLNDASIGLMQTLYQTAYWLHNDMGYRDYPLKSPDDLLNPEISMYFGGAMVNWLRTYRGQARSEEWIVMSYNGGPNAYNSQTRNHLSKYLRAKAQIREELGG